MVGQPTRLENPLLEDPLHTLLDLDKELRSVRGLLKVETARKVQLEECIEREKHKHEIWDNPDYDNGICEGIRDRIKRLNDKLKVRQESIDLLKGRLTNQIKGIQEAISKVLDKGTSLAEKIKMLFREHGITIASILMAIGMAIHVLIEVLLPSGGGVAVQGKGNGDDKPENVKQWLRNKLKALASLLGKLGVKVAEALPGIIGAVISWILNRAKEVMAGYHKTYGHWL